MTILESGNPGVRHTSVFSSLRKSHLVDALHVIWVQDCGLARPVSQGQLCAHLAVQRGTNFYHSTGFNIGQAHTMNLPGLSTQALLST